MLTPDISRNKVKATAMKALASRSARFDAIILSPGAPSYNQFRNFEERGDKFIELAKELFEK